MLKYFIEIKCRLILIVFNFIFISLITYLYKEIFLFLMSIVLTKTVDNYINYFIFTGITEILQVHYNLTKFIWLQIVNLYFFYNCFGFFALSFYKKEYFAIKRIFQNLLIACNVWFFLIVLVVVPASFNFFLSFKNLIKFSFLLSFEAKLNEFFNLYITFCSTLNESFQIFFILLSIIYYNSSNKRNFWKFWKTLYFCFVIFIIILMIDFFSQIIFSFIFIILYEFLLFGLLIKINLSLLINC